MEGFSVDEKCKALCEKLLNKDITFDKYVNEIKKQQGLNA